MLSIRPSPAWSGWLNIRSGYWDALASRVEEDRGPFTLGPRDGISQAGVGGRGSMKGLRQVRSGIRNRSSRKGRSSALDEPSVLCGSVALFDAATSVRVEAPG